MSCVSMEIFPMWSGLAYVIAMHALWVPALPRVPCVLRPAFQPDSSEPDSRRIKDTSMWCLGIVQWKGTASDLRKSAVTFIERGATRRRRPMQNGCWNTSPIGKSERSQPDGLLVEPHEKGRAGDSHFSLTTTAAANYHSVFQALTHRPGLLQVAPPALRPGRDPRLCRAMRLGIDTLPFYAAPVPRLLVFVKLFACLFAFCVALPTVKKFLVTFLVARHPVSSGNLFCAAGTLEYLILGRGQ